ncbi:MAG: hypothetical protein AMJ90_01195 [candidate division Zixibacteria bacterium SM23_73_2]|nr:MAG: hypothetical protein AMJ90_01195 [candidate division Zixibacteria bacterium SM23_73_2]
MDQNNLEGGEELKKSLLISFALTILLVALLFSSCSQEKAVDTMMANPEISEMIMKKMMESPEHKNRVMNMTMQDSVFIYRVMDSILVDQSLMDAMMVKMVENEYAQELIKEKAQELRRKK